MKKETKIKNRARIVMALLLVITTVFTGFGNMGVAKIEAAEGDTQITELNVNVDWSKVPSLTVGNEIGSFPNINLPNISKEVITVDSPDITDYVQYNWAVKLNQEHVDNGYILQDEYNKYSVYHNLAPLLNLDFKKSYTISENDTYYCYAVIGAKSGYKFADSNGVDVSNIVKRNIPDILALTDGEPGKEGTSVALFLVVGTPSEIENNKAMAKGYKYDAASKKLTILSDVGMDAWGNDSSIERTEITSVEIADGVTKISENAFKTCDALTSITIPDSVTTIGKCAFANCKNLEEITIPASVTDIGDQAFEGTHALEKVVMKGMQPANIGSDVFMDSKFVTEVKRGIKVPMPALKDYQSPEQSNWINYYDFIEGYKIGGYTFDATTGKLTIMSNVGAKYWNQSCGGDVDKDDVISVEIREGVTEIPEYAFEDCGALTSVSISDSVSTIGDWAFAGATALKKVIMEGTTPASIGKEIFRNTGFVNSNIRAIKVPTGLVETYQGAWGDWKAYIALETSGELDKKAEVAEDSPIKGAELANSKDELLNASGIFTENEKQQIENGANANVWLELNKVDLSTVSKADQTAILDKAKAYMGEGTELTYFDASLFKQIEGQSAQKVSEPGISIKLTIKIPTELLSTDKNVDRQYTIIRLHNGLAEEITGTFDETTGEFTFETDKFSTYAIAYKDTVKSNGGNQNGNDEQNGNGDQNGNGSQNGNTTGNSNGNQTVAAGNTTNTTSTGNNANTVASKNTSGTGTGVASSTPDTGDNSNIAIWLVVALMSLVVFVTAYKKRKA